MRTSLAIGIVLALFTGSSWAGSFQQIGDANAQATSLSRNGRIAAGSAGGSAWRWAKDRGTVTVTGFSGSNGMNSWGQPVAGAWLNPDGDEVAALAYSNSDLVGGPVVIGAYPGSSGVDGFLSEAYDVSDAGIAVGLAYDETGNPIAFCWSAPEGMTRLVANRPANAARANAISTDGSTIAGWNDQDDGYRSGVIWQDGIALDLLDAGGNPVGEALATNHDGSVVVGSGAATANGIEAWRWTAATGVQPIGFVGTMGQAFAFGVSDDGNVVVGASGSGFDRDAVIWTPDSGMVLLADYLAANDVVVPEGWRLSSASAVSADGRTIAGWGLAPAPAGLASWLVDLHPDEATEALVEAHGTVMFNDIQDGPFAGIAEGTPVTMTFHITTVDATELEPGQHTFYPILLDTFNLQAGTGSDTLVSTVSGPGLRLTNDYPLSDGIHLFSTPMASPGSQMEFELFNPGGDLFDSDDMARINRTFGPELFEKIAWSVTQGDFGMYMQLDDVSIHDVVPVSDTIFADGFD